MDTQNTQANLEQYLAGNPYPGRGILIGRRDTGSWVQVYWIMGRSPNSRNRIFVWEDDALRTQAADPSKVSDPSLIIYNAMRRVGDQFVVTNGAQTDGICDGLVAGRGFCDSLLPWEFEPDPPNNTPRISGLVDCEGGAMWLSVIKASVPDAETSDHQFFRYGTVPAGCGYAITTYMGDGDPLPSFAVTPYALPLAGDAARIADFYWDLLDADNKVSLAVREFSAGGEQLAIEIRNKYAAAS